VDERNESVPGPVVQVPGPSRGVVLIVDGDQAVRRIVSLVLEGAGFQCLACSSAEDAEAIVAESQPALVLAEVRLGDSSGQDLAERLALHSPSRPWFALMSAYPRPALGFEDYFLRKPLEFDQLIGLLDNLETHGRSQ
jgi:CheY-like chemotaxis protein